MPDGKGINAGLGEQVWIVSRYKQKVCKNKHIINLYFSDKSRYDEIFSSLEQHNGKITGFNIQFTVK